MSVVAVDDGPPAQVEPAEDHPNSVGAPENIELSLAAWAVSAAKALDGAAAAAAAAAPSAAVGAEVVGDESSARRFFWFDDAPGEEDFGCRAVTALSLCAPVHASNTFLEAAASSSARCCSFSS
jgi:hypothetical protein